MSTSGLHHYETPLHLASSTGKLDVVRVLIEKGADIHAKCKYGDVPLHLASGSGHLDVVRLLLDTCTAVDSRNEVQQTPVDLGVQKRAG